MAEQKLKSKDRNTGDKVKWGWGRSFTRCKADADTGSQSVEANECDREQAKSQAIEINTRGDY